MTGVLGARVDGHRWSAGDVAVWDNRCVQHYAVADYREERELHRLTIVGEVPEFH
jgi:taurine dioxygenase